VQVGSPQQFNRSYIAQKQAQSWESSFVRRPDPRPRWLYTTHLEGNEQSDKKNHGSLDQAVLLYAAVHYPIWQRELGLPEMGPGSFAENFTVGDMSEENVSIGAVYAIGDARVQVTGPRYPCWKINNRWGMSDLTERVAASGRTGWYCRVLQEGLIKPGQSIELLEQPYPTITVALVNDFGHNRRHDRVLGEELAACPLLNGFWPDLILKNLQRYNIPRM
jgi:MOSC domain-containing protein YiiM